MCGILGLVSAKNSPLSERFEDALVTLQHRGPDHRAVQSFTVGQRQVMLGHTRLAVVDLDARSDQPFCDSGSALIFNGEIYNYLDIRQRLDVDWKTTSDTEVLFHGLRRDGPVFLKQCNAMFALAHLDLPAGTLLLARDRMGKKPLYIWRTADTFAFASEPKALVELGMPADVDAESRAFYQHLGFIPGTKSYFKKATRLPAASWMEVNVRSLESKTELFWDPLQAFGQRYSGSYDRAQQELGALLDDATRLRLEADVPVSIFLSGGIDSTLVASAIARQDRVEASALVAKVDDDRFDESDVALATAASMNIPVKVLHFTDDDVRASVETLSNVFDEPLADPSQLPMMALSRKAKEFATVVLTGDGGDEGFVGYPMASLALKTFETGQKLGRFTPSKLLRKGLAGRESAIEKLLSLRSADAQSARTKSYLVQDIANGRTVHEMYERFRAMIHPEELAPELRHWVKNRELWKLGREFYPDYGWDVLETRTVQEQLAALDFVLYMRDDVLLKVDRATMSASLEARSPFLDYRIVEFGASLPLEYKVHAGQHKRILRDLLATRVPGAVSSLKKRGFGVPIPDDVLPAGDNPLVQYTRFQEQCWNATWKG